MTGLQPSPDFDWRRVSWGAPDEPASDDCSYCDLEIDEEEMPLIMWNAEGWCARFCEACQRKYWGMQCQ
jgi:hypothetical protein